MRTVASLRCSTKHQDQEMRAQRADILAWCDANGVVIAPEDWRAEPDVSGQKKERSELAKIVEECRAEEVGRIVFADFQRAGRRGAATVLMLEELADWGVELVFVRNELLDLLTYEGRAWALVHAAMGLLKCSEASKGAKAAIHVVDGVLVSRRNGLRVGRTPFVWTEFQDSEMLRLKSENRTCLEISKLVGPVKWLVPVDAEGRRAVKGGPPAVGRGPAEVEPSQWAIRDRLRRLREGRA